MAPLFIFSVSSGDSLIEELRATFSLAATGYCRGNPGQPN